MPALAASYPGEPERLGDVPALGQHTRRRSAARVRRLMRTLADRPVGCAGYGAAYFFAAGAFMSYWPVWLRDRGISDAEIGTLFMAASSSSVVATLAVGWLAHRLGGPRGVMVALAVAAVVMMGAYRVLLRLPRHLLVTMVWGCMWSPSMPLYDGVLVTETALAASIYGALRMWGSVAFIVGTLACAAWRSSAWARPGCSMSRWSAW